ncbi:MAG TPA: OmpA family protein [Saprospiraceae bacterium]|nr:OmpA family protein [Saprospiraceae bacterium]HMQ83466.1 OmpA family protein [Saprospiraceae bacterium]
MKKTFLTLVVLLVFLQLAFTQYDAAKDGIAIRGIFPNYEFPESNKWNSDNFGSGLEVEYIRHLNNALNLAIPYRVYQTDLASSTVGPNNDVGFMNLDLLLQLKYFKEPNFIYPYLYAGLGSNLQDLEDFSLSLPLGAAINLRIDRHVYLPIKGEYRLGLGDEAQDNLQLGAGLLFILGPGEPVVPPVTDRDGDGISDDQDLCPTVPGLQQFNGCPDSDGDGITDGEDECPQEAGKASLNGCPDRDGDGIADNNDECPDEPGIASLNGCPLRDRDGDGIADADDACPDVPGVVPLNGCPDKDGDGITDASDRCPDKPGVPAFNGCPDSDGDGLADPDDRCPNTAGPISNRGCPEIKQEDKEVLTFAMKAVQFETGKATLRPESYDILNQVAEIMNRYPDYHLTISGHTDSVGDSASNQTLSENRAKTCFEYLTSKGISANRMSHAGYGESRPIANNKYKSGRDQNRRVEFDIYLPDENK